MDQKHSIPMPMATSSAELMQAQAELWCHAFGYLKSMALYSAVKLCIPTTIHRCGGAATLSDLLAAAPAHPSKHAYLPRLMAMLAAAGIFVADGVPAGGEGAATATAAAAACVYRLTPVSRLLVDDDTGTGGRASLSPYVLMAAKPSYVAASTHLDQWLQSDGGDAAVSSPSKTPFMMAEGVDFFGAIGIDAELSANFKQGLEADSQLVVEPVVSEWGEVLFSGITSLVDVGGGSGAMATAIATAFPHVKCSVLELPHVVDCISGHGIVEFVAGDMMEFVPPADVVLLKFVLHNWSDEDCVKILKRCREAISQGGRAGKVIIIDTVVGSPSQHILEAQHLMDMCMMTFLGGKEREERHWHEIFMEAGFSHYKIRLILGVQSVIEVYP